MGKPKAAIVFSALTLLVYLWIIGSVAALITPAWTLIALLTLPFAAKAIRGSLKPSDMAGQISAMGSNVVVVLATQLLLGVGYIMAAVLL
jgi:1,4-dihydroxy-2-naphthoate octaprenyltransferase